jgi:methyl-accepting chemotaxis protein
MNEQNLTIDEAKDLLNQGFGSIYTKDEVLSLLDRIKKESTDIKTVLDEVYDDFVSKIKHFDESDVVNMDDVTFSVERGTEIVIEDISVNLHNIEEALEEVLNNIKDRY